MTLTVASQHETDIEDVEYIRHGNKPLLARVYKPRGTGPFPLIIHVHGGVWCKSDRMTDAKTDEPLARSGVVVAALDFRMPPEAGYPASLADINYAIRWFKTRATELGSRPGMVGIRGVSSGGHQAMLTAMRPHDPRYAALPLPGKATVDARVRCVVLCWPVIDPLGRYHYAQKLRAGSDPKLAEMATEFVSCHDKYWGGEAAMTEGNPTQALERGEPVQMPPVLYMQRTDDIAHPRPNLDHFIAGYRKAGGRVDLHFLKGVGSNEAVIPEVIEKMIEFVHREIRA